MLGKRKDRTLDITKDYSLMLNERYMLECKLKREVPNHNMFENR